MTSLIDSDVKICLCEVTNFVSIGNDIFLAIGLASC